MRTGTRCSALLALPLLLLAGPASAISLGAIDDAIQMDGSYVDTIGDLTFTFTKIEEVGGVDLDQIDLMLVSDGGGTGFDLNPTALGALEAANGAMVDVKLEFTVASTLGITGVSNRILSVITGQALAVLSELIVEEPGVDVGVSNLMPFASADFAAPRNLLTIDSKNLVLTAMADSRAEVVRVEQRYTVVPEPATASLLLLGLVGMARRFRI